MTGITTRAAREQRNEAIFKAIQDGAGTPALASQYRLAERTIRAIGQRMTEQYAAMPGPGGERAAVGPFAEAGRSGLKEAWGYIREEFLSELASPLTRYKLFDEMRQNSPIVAAMLQAIELSIKQVDWHVDGEDDRAEFVEGALDDMSHSLNEHLGEALTMLPFGFAPFEIVYKRRQGENGDAPSKYDDGKIGWRKFAFRSQDSLRNWDIDQENGSLMGMFQQAWNDYKLRYMPIEKMLLYRTTSEKGNPEGRSMLRPAYVPYYYIKNLQAVEAIGAERDLSGLPMIQLPEGANTDQGSTDLTNAEQIVRRVRQDEQAGAVIPFGWTFSLLSSPGTKSVDIGAMIERYEKRMAMVAMAQFLMLGMDKVGSYSLSKDHSDFFLMAISAIADNICETFNKYAIPRLLKLNGMSTVDGPKLVHGTPSEPDVQIIGDFLQKMASSGFILPDDEFEKWLRDLISAPALTPEMIAEREAKQQQAPPPPQPGQPGQQPGQPAQDGQGIMPMMKPGDGQGMGDGGDMPMGNMTLREQVARYAASGNGIRARIRSIPDSRTRRVITSASKDLVDLNRDIMKDKVASLKSITDEEWQKAVDADTAKERANGKGLKGPP